MSKPIWENKIFKIVYTGKDYVLIRKGLKYENHSHFRKLNGAKIVISLYNKKLIPNQSYFRSSMKRITTKEEYATFSYKKKKPKYYNRVKR